MRLPLWLRVGFSLPLLIGIFAVVSLPHVLGDGSVNLEANGGKRALTEWRTSLYGNLLPRRTLFNVYAKAGEEIALGSSGVGVGSGDIVVWTPGQIGAPLTVALPAPAFTCSTAQPGAGALTTRAEEVAGPSPAAGGYTPCIYTPATTGVYNVAFYGPAGGSSDSDGTAGTIAAPVTDASQNSGVSMWDITVRPIADPTATISGRVYTDYLAQITGGNGVTEQLGSNLWAVTRDGFQYKIDLRGLDPNGFILFGNTVGFLNPDGITPLYHDVVADINPLTNIEGGVELAPPSGVLFFAPPAPDLPPSITPTPVVPTVNSITFEGTAGTVSGIPGSVFSTGGNVVFDGNIDGVADVVIAPNPGGAGGCVSATFDPTLPADRSLVRVVSAGVQNLPWDGKDNSGAYMPASWTGNGGDGYCFSATLRAGEFHFPLLDAENSVLGGPTITLLNPPGGTCPFASCNTAFFDDRGYMTTSGAVVGTVGAVLPGNAPPPAPDFSDTGYDTASTTIRAYGDNSGNGFGNQKGLDLWTYFPSEDVVGQLYVIPQVAADLAITKTHVGTFTVGVDGAYTLSVQNVGTGTISGLITVTDPVPAGLTVVSAAGTGWACGVAAQLVTCTVTPSGGLPAATSLPDITVIVNPTAAAVPSVTNTATVANATDTDPGNDSSSSATAIDIVADLSITKTDGTAAVTSGTATTYAIVVTNSGPSGLTGAKLADPAVTGLAKTAVACAPTPGQCVTPPSVVQVQSGTFALPALASGQTYRLSVTANVTAASGSVTNTATVAVPSGTTDSDATNNSAADTDTVNAAPAADLSITKTDGTAAVTSGTATTYTVIVTNNGPSDVTGAILADPAATGLTKTAVACASTPGQCVTAPTIVELQSGTFALPALASGQTYRLSVTANVTAASGSVTNTATIATPAGTTDPDPTNNSAADTDAVNAVPAPALTLAKGASPTTFTAAGDVIAYTYLLTNSGNVALSGPFTVTDDKTTVTCPVTASLAIGDSITCTAVYTITPADVLAGSVTNVATASAADGPTSNEDTVTVTRSAPPTAPPTPPNTEALTGGGSSGPPAGALGWLVVVSLLAAASVLTAGWIRRRR